MSTEEKCLFMSDIQLKGSTKESFDKLNEGMTFETCCCLGMSGIAFANNINISTVFFSLN